MIRLTVEQVINLHDELIRETGGSFGVRDAGALDSALNSPFQVIFGSVVFPSVQQKAARLGFGLIQNHPFVDGNKRIGAHFMLVFLAINGVELKYRQDELVRIVLAVAKGEAETPELLAWIIEHESR